MSASLSSYNIHDPAWIISFTDFVIEQISAANLR
jgi:hypothetical protein